MLQLPVSQFEVVNTCFPADSRFHSRLLSWTRESEKQFFFAVERLFFFILLCGFCLFDFCFVSICNFNEHSEWTLEQLEHDEVLCM